MTICEIEDCDCEATTSVQVVGPQIRKDNNGEPLAIAVLDRGQELAPGELRWTHQVCEQHCLRLGDK